VDKRRLLAEKETPEIPDGSGPRSRRGVSGGRSIPRLGLAGRRPRRAPTFARVAASGVGGRNPSLIMTPGRTRTKRVLGGGKTLKGLRAEAGGR